MIQDIFPHRLDNAFHPGTALQKDSLIFCFSGNDLLVRPGQTEISLPVWQDLAPLCEKNKAAGHDFGPGTAGNTFGNAVYLFTLDERSCFWVDPKFLFPNGESLPAGAGTELPHAQGTGEAAAEKAKQEPGTGSLAGHGFRNLRELRKEGFGPQHLFFAAYTAMQLIHWYQDNAYCGRCAAKTVHSQTERALICPSCKRTIYPRIIPAVIVGVTDGDRIVLTKYAGRDVPYFALIAGFTEIGETLEETVQREVMEEVGLKVRNIRYYKSQPWAMADDILMGFYCDVDGDRTIRLDRNELKEGGWYRRDEIILQPDDYSLTNEMMKMFKEGKQ